MGVPPSSGENLGRNPFRANVPSPRATRRRAIGAALAFGAGAAYAFLRWRPSRIEIAGASMRPALEPGDWALAVASGRIRRGDVVVVEHPDRPGFEMVKRIVAVPGDVAPDGSVLGPGRFWVQGDAADASTDSRAFGPVSRPSIRAHVRVVYRPIERRRLL